MVSVFVRGVGDKWKRAPDSIFCVRETHLISSICHELDEVQLLQQGPQAQAAHCTARQLEQGEDNYQWLEQKAAADSPITPWH